MIEKLNQILRGLIERVKDSGWEDLTLSTYNTIWTVNRAARARKIGNLVQLQFIDIRTTGTISTGGTKLVNALPEEFRPDVQLEVPIIATPSSGLQFGGKAVVGTDGSVTIFAPGSGQYSPTYGISVNITYFVGGGYCKRVISVLQNLFKRRCAA